MLGNWLFKPWKHNKTSTKLIPLIKSHQKPYWLYLLIGTITFAAASYSFQGFIHDIFPNLPFIKSDRERLVLKRRAFDTLVMSHKEENSRRKCLEKSLF